MYGYIYKITNLINKKIYIGKREKSYFDDNYWGSGVYLKNALNKYKKENFKKEILNWCKDKKSLCEAEQYFIKFYHSTDSKIGYNITKGGEGGDTFSNRAFESKEKSREKNRKHSLNKVYIYKNGKYKSIKKYKLSTYLKNGWIKKSIPVSEKTRKKQKESASNLIWITNGVNNKRISKKINITEKFPGFYCGYTHHNQSKEDIKRKLKLKRKALEKEFLKKPHYCEKCGKLITRLIGKGRFCSRKCASTHNHSIETKKHLAELCKLGICGRKGKRSSPQTIEKLKKSLKKYYSDPKHKKITINNHKSIKKILVSDLNNYLQEGWVLGCKGLKKPFTPWNKGLTKDDPKVKKALNKRNQTLINKYGNLKTWKFRKKK